MHLVVSCVACCQLNVASAHAAPPRVACRRLWWAALQTCGGDRRRRVERQDRAHDEYQQVPGCREHDIEDEGIEGGLESEN